MNQIPPVHHGALLAHGHTLLPDNLRNDQDTTAIRTMSMPHQALNDSLIVLTNCWFLQFAFNTLSRVSPVSHGVCNVVKRVVIIGTSVVFFGTTLTPKTKLGKARMSCDT